MPGRDNPVFVFARFCSVFFGELCFVWQLRCEGRLASAHPLGFAGRSRVDVVTSLC